MINACKGQHKTDNFKEPHRILQTIRCSLMHLTQNANTISEQMRSKPLPTECENPIIMLAINAKLVNTHNV